MRHRLIATILILLTAVVQTVAQGLADRYSRQRPVVVICDDNEPYSFTNKAGQAGGIDVDIIKAITDEIGIPCTVVIREKAEARKLFEDGKADLIISNAQNYGTQEYFISENIDYRRNANDSIDEMQFISKDHQLIEQIDAKYTRLKQNGDIAEIREAWLHPEQVQQGAAPVVLYIILALILLVVALGLLCLYIIRRTKSIARNSADISKMIYQAQQIGKYYAKEDNQAAHDLLYKYNAILCNPFLAISFYDNNGQVIVQNEAMKEIDDPAISERRRPIYNAKGEIANYFVAIRRPADAK
ncbi:MAG: transporter substrate-binding domain-containing protein [Prevotella sp.]|nr:transporter substrate-binding domain-containing protein [Prevotella sp.]MBR1556872.1 transporter substrate-binding domain-containing protein [Prevotella sp.]